jgi:hypothetical protein
MCPYWCFWAGPHQSGWQNDLKTCVIWYCLEDLRFLGSKFTWTNRQCHNPILKKWDWVLVNVK